MAEAMKNVIQTTGIAMVAGETAVLGMSHEASRIYTAAKQIIDDIRNILDNRN
jgi:hypothetical protein